MLYEVITLPLMGGQKIDANDLAHLESGQAANDQGPDKERQEQRRDRGSGSTKTDVGESYNFV